MTFTPSTVTRPAATISSDARREATPAWARYFARRIPSMGSAISVRDRDPSAATIGGRAIRARSDHGPRAARPHARRRGRAQLSLPPGVGVAGARGGRLRGDDRPAGTAARAPGRRGAVLEPSAARTGAGRGRHRQGPVRHRRGAPAGGGADALPRRAPLGLPVLAVRMPADVHLLRHRLDAFRAQPVGVGDPRPGAALPPPRRDRPLRVHGHGRADAQPRRGAGRLRTAARTSASPTGARRSRPSAGYPGSAAWPNPTCRCAWRCRCTHPKTRCAPS